ncbi:hypothetical protein [Pararhizobium sp. DWP3-4]|uniref:hypothetical protein n=1 Tax=Pararhizobium sp. DWP3-4 TaxID=2804565 RepID=UPI003CF4836F
MIVDVNNPKLIKSQLTLLSNDPLRGLLVMDTDKGQARVEIDEDSANDLLDEILSLFGVPRPPSAGLKTSAGL